MNPTALSFHAFALLRIPLVIAVVTCLLSSPTQGEDPKSAPTGPATASNYKIETVASGLEVPWAFAFASDGRLFLTERPGRLRLIEQGKLRPQPLEGLVGVEAHGEIGLMGIALHPDFDRNQWIYLSHGSSDGQTTTVQVTRYRFEGNRLLEPRVILDKVPAKRLHAGCRILFGPDRKLYVTTGDAGTSPSAQALEQPIGKTLRLNEDGTIPTDNPFPNTPGRDPRIWTYGHRNAQGLAWDKRTSTLFEVEHGPSDWDAPGGGDELNALFAGGNFGWPAIHHTQTAEGMEAPVAEWTPAIAPGGMAIYSGPMFPDWEGDALIAGLKGECIVRVDLDGKKAGSQERLLEKKYGRIREVAVAPDGSIYCSTSNEDGYGKKRSENDSILRLSR